MLSRRAAFLLALLCGIGASSIGAQALIDSLDSWKEQWAICREDPTCGSTNELHQKLIAAFREADDLENYTWHFWERQAADLDNKTKALSWLDEAQAGRWRAAKSENEWGAICYEEISRAFLLKDLGDILGSIRAFERAERLYSEHLFGYVDVIEQIYKPLMNNYTRLGDNRNALLIADQALRRIVPRHNVEAASGLFNNAGIAAWNGGNYAQADSLFQLGTQLPNLPPLQAGQLFFSQARNQWSQGQKDLANWTLGLSEAQFRRMPNAEGRAYEELRIDQLSLRAEMTEDAQRAMTYYEEALEKIRQLNGSLDYQRQAGKIYNQIARLTYENSRNGPLDKALARYNDALKCLLPAYEPIHSFAPPPADSLLYAENTLLEALDNKAQLLLPTHGAQALANFKVAQRVAFLLHATYQTEAERLNAQARNLERTETALKLCYRLQAGELVATPELAQSSTDYQLAALRWMEQNRSILLSEARQDSEGLGEDDTVDSLLQLRTELRRQLNFLEANGAELELRANQSRQLAALQAELEQQLPVTQRMGPELDLDNLQYLREQEGTLLLSYFYGERSAYCFYLMGEEQGLVALEVDTAARQGLFEFINLLADRQALIENPDLYLEYGKRVRQTWLPDELPWHTAQRLVIIADGRLHQLPFSALPIGESGTPLLRKLSLRRIYSLQVGVQPTTLEAYPGPEQRYFFAPFNQQGRDQWPSLPYSGEEMDCEYSSCDLDQAASTSALQAALHTEIGKRPRFQLLHLSTHAQATDGDAQIACFDGQLSLADISRLRIPAELVILSACETNVGEYLSGEGVYSLARNFTYAGAHSLVASHWSVNDRSTAWIMQHFHRELEAGNDRVEALRSAQLAYLDRTDISAVEKLPFYWAAFSLTGADGPIFSTSAGLNLWWTLLLLPGLIFIFWGRKK
ncbi:MAG: CHAT domain-containing protein [Bacteroidota bacterium]